MNALVRPGLSICAAALFAGCGGSQLAISAPSTQNNSGDLITHHHKFEFTGAEQTFKVPAGVTSITVIALGAAGSGEGGGRFPSPGYGGRVDAVIPIQSQETLYVFVGGEGSTISGYKGGGFNGGGNGAWGYFPVAGSGGGASDVREGGDNLSDRILVAGGGGGQGGGPELDYSSTSYGAIGYGGKGGDKIGQTGGLGFYGRSGGGGGRGGTPDRGGNGAKGGGRGERGHGHRGESGTLASGGQGGRGGEGGGGGYYGGGGGGGGNVYYGGGGGGGGSSYVEASATDVQMWQGWQYATGNGLFIFKLR